MYIYKIKLKYFGQFPLCFDKIPKRRGVKEMFLRLRKGPSAKGARQTQLTGIARYIAIQRCTKHCIPVSIAAARLVLVRG